MSTDQVRASPAAASPERPVEAVDAHFVQAVSRWVRSRERRDPDAPVRDGTTLTGRVCLQLFDAQIASRHADLMARQLRVQNQGFYTIGSSGHEGNAAVAAALRSADPAFLHYRSGAFYIARSHQHAGDPTARLGGAGGPPPATSDPIRDILLGVCTAVEEPIAGGRHKVFGHPDRAVIPQTSTIASHLPRALGVAFSIPRAARLGVECQWPADAIAVASFGDASVNHSTAAGAINTAAWVAYQRLPLPLLLVCEDNGLGISVRTPPGWIEAAYGSRPGLRYLAADGCDVAAVWDAATGAASYVRERRAPAFLHLSVIRYMGHAGSDAEVAYRTPKELSADLERDPLLTTARLLVEAGLVDPDGILDRYEAMRQRVRRIGEEAARARRLATAVEIMAPLSPRTPDTVAERAACAPPDTLRAEMHGGRLPEHQGPRTLAQAINAALADGLAAYPNMVVFGEDVAAKGGVYGVTAALSRRAGPMRVFDSILDEQSILGLALGAGLCGLLPVPEIQYLAYLHNAEDQLRGEAATQQFFSAGRYRNPMVVRIAAYGYQKGFGGHFHNDNSVAVLRDIPGLVIASPSRPDDAAAMLRTCLAAASVDGAVCVFLEPIALYHTRELLDPGDGEWAAPYAAPAEWKAAHVPIGSARVYGEGRDLTIVTFANGVPMSLRVARRLADSGIQARVVDLRWLAPMPLADLSREARASGRVLIVDETRRSGGVSEGIMAALVDSGFQGPIRRVASEDSFIPLGDAASLVLVSEAQIEEAARAMVSSG